MIFKIKAIFKYFFIFSLKVFLLIVIPISYAEETQFSVIKPTSSNEIETIKATTSRLLLQRFNAENSNIRVHELHKTANDHKENLSSPALKLERIYVGENSTLLEILGLNRQGNKTSAVIRSDTFGIRESSGDFHKNIAHEGVTELRDRKGGVALVVNSGETLFVLTGPINDLNSFSVEHTSWGDKPFTYFDNIDPRFQERYQKRYDEAVTPEKMKDFIVEFSKNDPDGKVREVFVTLIKKMRKQKTFEGYYNAYLLMQDPEDASMASSLARTKQHEAMMEHIAVATLRDKGRLIDFDLQLDSTYTKDNEGSCMMFCEYYFTATRKITGTLKVRRKSNAPIKLQHGTYKLTFSVSGLLPRYKKQRSRWVGNVDAQDNNTIKKEVSVILRPPNYTENLSTKIGSFDIAFFKRGSAGGYTAIWANGDGKITVTLKNVELQK